jgi:DNA polymerase-3 subunit delta'
MSFSEILGQKYAIEILENSLRSGRISHAYLFSGPEGVGKELTALKFAQALLCEKKDNLNPCNTCRVCKKIISNTSVDVKIVEAEKTSMNIKIEQIREIQRDIFLRPIEGKWKIYILKEVEKMNQEASNCFLKILEEPPKYGIFILLTTNLPQIPETIVSRCQVIKFEILPKEIVLKVLKNKLKELPEEKIQIISNLCLGQLGVALERKEDLYIKRDEVLKILLSLSAVEMFQAIKAGEITRNLLREEKDQERKKLIEILEAIIFIFRDVLILKETKDFKLLINFDKREEIEELAKNYSRENILKIIELLREIKGYVKRNVNINILLEYLFINIAKLNEGGI